MSFRIRIATPISVEYRDAIGDIRAIEQAIYDEFGVCSVTTMVLS